VGEEEPAWVVSGVRQEGGTPVFEVGEQDGRGLGLQGKLECLATLGSHEADDRSLEVDVFDC
jgi:hypothetical protein